MGISHTEYTIYNSFGMFEDAVLHFSSRFGACKHSPCFKIESELLEGNLTSRSQKRELSERARTCVRAYLAFFFV